MEELLEDDGISSNEDEDLEENLNLARIRKSHAAATIMIRNLTSNNLAIEQILGVPDPHRDSTNKKRRKIERNFDEVEKKLRDLYFGPSPKYGSSIFERKYRLPLPLYLKIRKDLMDSNDFFVRKSDHFGRKGTHPDQKILSALRTLIYGTPSHLQDELLQLGEETSRRSLIEFCETIISLYQKEVLRPPTVDDLKRLYKLHEDRWQLPGLVGGLDCMHWVWDRCPVTLHGQYKDRDGKKSVILEAVADQNMRFWHANFGTPGSCNDINALHRSSLFRDFYQGKSAELQYVLNATEYRTPFYLVDGIYNGEEKVFTLLVGYPPTSDTPEKKTWIEIQQAARKMVERAFGNLQCKFRIVSIPSRYPLETMNLIMLTCIILVNMIIDYREQAKEENMDDDADAEEEQCDTQENVNNVEEVPEGHMNRWKFARSKAVKQKFEKDIMQHVYKNRSRIPI